jgi:predicted RNase H-like HicB family nuclease
VEVTERKTYTARCTRSGNWWAIDVPEVAGVHTQSKRLDSAEAMARDAITLMLEVPEDSFEIDVEPVLPSDVEHALAEWADTVDEAKDAETKAKSAVIALLVLLVAKHGMSYRDAGKIVGLSHQRVQQILKEAA